MVAGIGTRWNLGFTLACTIALLALGPARSVVAAASVQPAPTATTSSPATLVASYHDCSDDAGRVYRVRQLVGEKFRAFFVSCTAVAQSLPAAAPETAAADVPAALTGVAFPKQRQAEKTLSVRLRSSAKARRQSLLPTIQKVAEEYRLDAQLLAAIVHVESRFTGNAVSPKGALGLMQIMPDTGRRYGVCDKSRLLTDAYANLSVGARYLRDLFRLFEGRTDLVLAAYNAGEGAVLRNNNAVPPYPETEAYVASVLDIYRTCRVACD